MRCPSRPYPMAIIMIINSWSGMPSSLRSASVRRFGRLMFSMQLSIPIPCNAQTRLIEKSPPSIHPWLRSPEPANSWESTVTIASAGILSVNPVFPFWNAKDCTISSRSSWNRTCQAWRLQTEGVLIASSTASIRSSKGTARSPKSRVLRRVLKSLLTSSVPPAQAARTGLMPSATAIPSFHSSSAIRADWAKETYLAAPSLASAMGISMSSRFNTPAPNGRLGSRRANPFSTRW